MPQRRRLANRLGLLAAALIFVAVGVGVVLGAQRFIVDANRVSHTNEVIALVVAIEAQLRDGESAQRGYLLTADVDYLADYQRSRGDLPEMMVKLQALVRDNPDQSRRVLAWKLEIERRLGQMDAILGNYATGGLASAQRSIGQEARRSSAALRAQARQLVASEQQLLVQRAESSRTSANLLRALAILGIPLGLVIIAVVYGWLVAEIRHRARAEADGDDARGDLVRNIQALEQHGADLNELSRYGGMLQSCVRAEEAIGLATQYFSRLLPETGGTLYRVRASQDYAEEVAHWGEHAINGPAMFPLPDCWALRRGQPHIHRAHHELLPCNHVSTPSLGATPTYACVPLIAQGSQLGLLYLSSHDDAFLARLDLVKTAAEQLSMALSSLDLQARLRVQSIREPLTGLFNRRYLEESLARELARCERRGMPLGLMMLDLDHFKRFNDLHGHAGGDALLSEFGRLLQALSRDEDIACRYGGEEFTLILPEADPLTVQARAEAIRAGVEGMRVMHLGQELPPVTVSIGVAMFPQHGGLGESLMRHADAALYRAKHAGRNRVETATLDLAGDQSAA
ncbi:diguanylate cyclase [Pseudoxanthomonas sp.]|uniref:sensor domain-containing diguanylate cyclase n=1 Tax=Pseudoxanthomonas sp. TaxID=1871049 RepID=UPI002FE026D0